MARRTQDTVLAAFSEEQTARLTGISQTQLRYWDRTGFFIPSLAYEDRRSAYSRVYSFRDIACLRVINALRNDAKVPLPHLRDVKEKLSHLGEDLWSKTTLYVLNKKVIFSADGERKEEVVSGQVILQIPLKVVSGSVQEAVKTLLKREQKSIGKIERHRNIAGNQEVIAGTRIAVRSIKAFSDAGYSVEQIQKEYPTLTRDDIAAALKHATAA